MMIKERLIRVQERIQEAAVRSRRNPAEVALILVSKTVPPEGIQEAFEAGARDFGENRVQELLKKKPGLPPEIRWHFQGHLQTNKVKFLLGEVEWLHSLDRVGLAREIEKQAEKRNLAVDALLQVNTTREPTKSGCAPEEVGETLGKMSGFSRIRIRGLMTIGPLTQDERLIRKSFGDLRKLRDKMVQEFPDKELQELSMGMSSDFEIAIEEGSTMVRIGTAVFGERR